VPVAPEQTRGVAAPSAPNRHRHRLTRADFIRADLIRHGKNHHNASKSQSVEAGSETSPSPTDYSSRTTTRSTQPSSKSQSTQQTQPATMQQQQQQQQQHQAVKKEQIREQAVAQNVVVGADSKTGHRAREAAEQIVLEEREAKTKMPTYKGLENYRLLEKMGECVVVHVWHLTRHPNQPIFSLQRRFLQRLQGS
jgi:serine/threonine-protein kinase RCK2